MREAAERSCSSEDWGRWSLSPEREVEVKVVGGETVSRVDQGSGGGGVDIVVL